MEYQKIPSMVLLLVSVALIVGVGVLLFDKFSDATKTSTAATDENVVISSTLGTLTNDELVSNSNVGIGNATISCFLLDNPACGNVTSYELGTIDLNASFQDGTYKANYSYYADSKASLTSDAAGTGIGDIADTWMSLIVTILVMAIIIGMVVYSFNNKR